MGKIPKYIKKKIQRQNQAAYKAFDLLMEINDWCNKKGVDISSEEYGFCFIGNGHGADPISLEKLEELYDNIRVD